MRFGLLKKTALFWQRWLLVTLFFILSACLPLNNHSYLKAKKGAAKRFSFGFSDRIEKVAIDGKFYLGHGSINAKFKGSIAPDGPAWFVGYQKQDSRSLAMAAAIDSAGESKMSGRFYYHRYRVAGHIKNYAEFDGDLTDMLAYMEEVLREKSEPGLLNGRQKVNRIFQLFDRAADEDAARIEILRVKDPVYNHWEYIVRQPANALKKKAGKSISTIYYKKLTSGNLWRLTARGHKNRSLVFDFNSENGDIFNCDRLSQ